MYTLTGQVLQINFKKGFGKNANCEVARWSCELRVAGWESRVASCELRVAGCGLRGASW